MFGRLRIKIKLWRMRRFERKLNKTGLHLVTLFCTPMRKYNKDGSFTGGKTMLFTDYVLEQDRKLKEKLEAERKGWEALAEYYKTLGSRIVCHNVQRPEGWKREFEEKLNKDPMLCFYFACMQEHKPGGGFESLPPLPRSSILPVDSEPVWFSPKFVTSGFKEIYEDDNN